MSTFCVLGYFEKVGLVATCVGGGGEGGLKAGTGRTGLAGLGRLCNFFVCLFFLRNTAFVAPFFSNLSLPPFRRLVHNLDRVIRGQQSRGIGVSIKTQSLCKSARFHASRDGYHSLPRNPGKYVCVSSLLAGVCLVLVAENTKAEGQKWGYPEEVM